MNIGKLNKRLAIQSAIETRGNSGQVIKLWTTDDIRWGWIEPLQGKEAQTVKQVEASTTHRITIRYYSGLSTQHRFMYAGRIFDILAIIDQDEKHEQMQCLCVEQL
jgi:SPP1 family predicted phage head-tail adaptor